MLAYAGRGNVVPAPLCLAAATGEMATLLHAVASSKVDLRLELVPAVVDGDATQLQQVVMNLVTNACEALGDRPGTVTVRTGVRAMTAAELTSSHAQDALQAGEYAFLEVTDTGAGMDPATEARIFEPFYSTKWTGRGLGLAAVLGIVRAHRGLIRVATTPGGGTTMTVVLPRSASPAVAPQREVQAPATGAGHVLVIDDEDDVLRVTRRLLERAGFTVSEAPGSEAGIARVQAEPTAFGAVLIDLTMPRMDGWQVAARVRAIAPSLPCVLMSGYADPRAAEVADPTMPFVQKPFFGGELVAAVQKAMAHAAR